MASSRDRQRALARAKLDRQLARRAARLRRRRRVQAGLGAAAALLLIVGGIAWLGGAFDGDEEDGAPTAAGDICVWTPQNAGTNSDLKDVGTPPTAGIPTTGARTFTLATNRGAPIGVTLDVTGAPCSAASLVHLAQRGFYDGTACHEITKDGALRCGDPSGTGQGGPTYTIYDENLPPAADPQPSASGPATAKRPPAYPKGTVALVGNPPGSNGSQFLVFLRDFAPERAIYPVVGRVTSGQSTLDAVAKIPTKANAAGDKVTPAQQIVISKVTVGEPAQGGAPAPSAGTQS